MQGVYLAGCYVTSSEGHAEVAAEGGLDAQQMALGILWCRDGHPPAHQACPTLISESGRSPEVLCLDGLCVLLHFPAQVGRFFP